MLQMKKNSLYIIIILISTVIVFFTYNNHFLYKSPIIKIVNIENISNEKENDESINQIITGVIKNGEYKGKTLKFNNESSVSGVLDEQIHKNSELFVKVSNKGTSVQDITGIKRDKYVIILLVLFIDLVIFIGKTKGIRSLFSLFLNVLISVFTVHFYIAGKLKIDILLLFITIAIIFIITSMILCNGPNKKSKAAIISSIISLLISFGIAYIILKYYNSSINYYNMDYIEVIKDYEKVFYINVLLSGLGAIMDIAITMTSSLNELIEKDNNISYKTLRKSGNEISKDILGTMTNVMLFTCYISIIPMIILVMRNGIPLISAINTYGQLEMIRVLTSCISIVLAIPISLYVALFVLKKVKRND